MTGLAAKLELVQLADGPLVVNLETGAYFAVNETAAFVCRQLLDGASDGDIVSRLIEQHGLAVLAAHRALAGVVEALADPGAVAEPVGALRYRATAWGYAFHLDGTPVLETRGDGAVLRLVGDRRAPPEIVEGWIRCLAAKVLSLQGVPVLHAAACAFGEATVAICGQSGAGKTTTARAFAAAGRELYAEDMVVLDLDARPAAFIAAEPALRRWAARTGDELVSEPAREIDCRALAELVRVGSTRALDAVFFLDPTRRRGSEIAAEPVGPRETLAELLQSSFLGSSEPAAWRAFVAANAAVARAIRGARLSVPDGLEPLAAAARRFDYSASSTS
jgi:urease gamma subunit